MLCEIGTDTSSAPAKGIRALIGSTPQGGCKACSGRAGGRPRWSEALAIQREGWADRKEGPAAAWRSTAGPEAPLQPGDSMWSG